MKIFISYAHNDEDDVRELADILTDFGHEPWFDHRLVVARAWQDQLLDAIRECECFLYALTPVSFASAWCQWEFAQAVHAEKPVIPVLLKATELNGALARIQYADFTGDVDIGRQTARLLRGVREATTIDPELVPLLPAPDEEEPERPTQLATPANPLADRFLDEAVAAFRAKNYAEARDLLRDCLEIDSEHAEAQKLLALVERRVESTQPESEQPTVILRSVTDILPPPFEWVDIPAGSVELEDGHGWFDVPAFQIAKYPITNAQFAVFVEAGGYEDQTWWTDAGWNARATEKWAKPRYWNDPAWNGAEYPIVGVSWYEAFAYCRWLSAQTDYTINLPTELQWQRAAQGDDRRTYPWGNETPSKELCNFEKNVGHTTPVTQYPNGASPYVVLDMVGNVWEWCLNQFDNPRDVNVSGNVQRVLRGGSWSSLVDFTRVAYREINTAGDRYRLIGFRIVHNFASSKSN